MLVSGGGGKPDVAGLWIDYVLLPEKLDEHLDGLARESLSSPSHVELIIMFLEQAVTNHKLSKKETDVQGTNQPNKPGNRTASVLCERAVRVAVAAKFGLAAIEALIPKHLQSLLLKALIKYDKDRSLVHECDFHRWVIHKVLSPETLGIPPPNSGNRIGLKGADSTENIQDSIFSGEIPDLEEGPSVLFLENVLEKEKSVLDIEKPDMKRKSLQNGTVRDGGLTVDQLCLVLFDVAEAHFMRGRVKKAHELFTKCGYLATGFDPAPVPQDRLHGFIVACRAVTGSATALHSEDDLVAKLPGQEAVFACEKSRSSIKRKSQLVSPDYCNGVRAPASGSQNKRTSSMKTLKVNGLQSDDKQVPIANGCEVKRSKVGDDAESQDGAEGKEHKDLVEVLADDILEHHLSWGYCLSLERDSSLSAAVRSKIATCNVLRSVLDGSPFDSFLRISDQLENNKEAVLFFLELMSNVRRSDEAIVHRMQQFCIYVCCILDESWCWELAYKHDLISSQFTSDLRDQAVFSSQVVRKKEGSRCTRSSLLDVLLAGNLVEVEDAASAKLGHSSETLARVVRMRAFKALDKENDFKFARQLYGLSRRIHPEDIESGLFLWYLDRIGISDPDLRAALPERVESHQFPSSGALEYIFVKVMEGEQWSLVFELCNWGQRRHFMQEKAIAFLFNEAAILGGLMHICSGDLPATRSEEVSQKFEDLMALFFGTKDESARSKDCLLLGLRTFPIISKLSSVKPLEALENLLAGWINRLHSTAPIVELTRYSALAQVTTAAASSKLRVSRGPDCGKKLFGFLLDRLSKLPKAVQDGDKGSRWLLGLGDLAFVDRAYMEALQFYLQAGAVRSSFYCDRLASMGREFFTPWVITRMIAACKEVGAQLQAAILCQCLPDPDYESAFQILQANPLIVDHDAALYFECIWEIPILELLVHMHSKAGDRARVNTLINLLQQPALNVHNPASIRQAHITVMEQRFLQRFYAELV